MGTVLFFKNKKPNSTKLYVRQKNRTVLNPNSQKPVAIKDLEMILP